MCEQNNVKNFIQPYMTLFGVRRREIGYLLKKGMWRKVSEYVSCRDSKYESNDRNDVDVIGSITIIVAIFVTCLTEKFNVE